MPKFDNDMDSFMRAKSRASKAKKPISDGYPCPTCGEPNMTATELRVNKQCHICLKEDSDKIPDEVA